MNPTYFHANRRRPSAFYLMFMSEECDTGQSSPIIKATYLSISDNTFDVVLDETHPLSAHRVWLTCRYLHFQPQHTVLQVREIHQAEVIEARLKHEDVVPPPEIMYKPDDYL